MAQDTEEDQLEPLLHVGAAVFLQLGIAGNCEASHVRSAIRGWKPETFIVVDLPPALTATTTLKLGMTCVVRFMSHGVVCGFTSRALDLDRTATHPNLTIAWPRNVETVHMRREERLDVSITCTLRIEEGSPLMAQIRDLSAGGCCVVTDAEIAVGQFVRLSFGLPDGISVHGAIALVRNRRMLDAQRRSYGCQFDADDADGASDVGYFVHSALERMRGATRKGPRVLIGSPGDNALLKETRSQLAAAGYDVIWTTTAIDTVFRMRLSAVDILILGAEFPGISGAAVCTMIKGTSGYEQLPVALCIDERVASSAAASSASEFFMPTTPAGEICAFVRRHAPVNGAPITEETTAV